MNIMEKSGSTHVKSKYSEKQIDTKKSVNLAPIHGNLNPSPKIALLGVVGRAASP
jgi:hypothetical protein